MSTVTTVTTVATRVVEAGIHRVVAGVHARSTTVSMLWCIQ